MSNNGTSPLRECSSSPGAERATRTHTECTHGPPENEAAQRSRESLIAEQSFKSKAEWSIPARAHGARVLAAALRKHDWTKGALALHLQIDRKIVKRWIDGERPIPVDLVFALPRDLAADFALGMLSELGASGDRVIEFGLSLNRRVR